MGVIALLALLFVVVPILEFTVLIEIGRRIGTVYTLILVFGTGIAGAALARMEGLRILTKLQDNLRAGVMPTEQLFDGFMVLIAGILLITPGFLSDVTGLLLLFPPTRLPIKMALRRMIRQWIAARTMTLVRDDRLHDRLKDTDSTGMQD